MRTSRFDRSLAQKGAGSSATTTRDRKLEQMLVLAAEMGFVCEPVTKFRQEFLSAITKHLVHREGKNVYQSPAFNIPMFSKTAAETMFGEANKVASKGGTVGGQPFTSPSLMLPGLDSASCHGRHPLLNTMAAGRGGPTTKSAVGSRFLRNWSIQLYLFKIILPEKSILG